MPPTAPSLDADVVARLRLAVLRLARRLRQQAQTGITPSQLSALATLDRTGPLPLGELAAAEQIGASTLTRIVACLHDDGLVDRTVDPADRRVSRVGVTPKGRRLLKRARSRSDVALAERLAALDPDDAAALLRAVPLLERLVGEET
ncbi:MAG: MarR family transcriptional regulator [Actinomycetota bacterium]|nr:MarR family transcriptional regulator [Actinomycetota bacterium]